MYEIAIIQSLCRLSGWFDASVVLKRVPPRNFIHIWQTQNRAYCITNNTDQPKSCLSGNVNLKSPCLLGREGGIEEGAITNFCHCRAMFLPTAGESGPLPSSLRPGWEPGSRRGPHLADGDTGLCVWKIISQYERAAT